MVFRDGEFNELGMKLADPALILERHDGKWAVRYQVYIPTMGPGDFLNYWATVEEAIAEILDFFVVHPERSREAALLREEYEKRSGAP